MGFRTSSLAIVALCLTATHALAVPVAAGGNRAQRPPAAKMVVQIQAKNTAAVPGETRTVEATLTSQAGQGVPGKVVVFTFQGPNGTLAMGTGTTNASGRATVQWAPPELAQGAYTFRARFAGDATTLSATDQANFGIIKGITKLTLSDLIWGPLDAHGGPSFGVVMVRLERQADHKALAKPITMTVNGNTWVVNNGSNPTTSIQIALPSNTHQWNVKAQFMGDAANQASMAQRAYSHN
ncbi:MAG: Ig-like domain repeat protein [bacterium]